MLQHEKIISLFLGLLFLVPYVVFLCFTIHGAPSKHQVPYYLNASSNWGLIIKNYLSLHKGYVVNYQLELLYFIPDSYRDQPITK